MPYVPQEDRDHMQTIYTPGQLTWAITDLVLRFLDSGYDPEPSFQRFAEALGSLEAVKLELYRRSVAPYEDVKRKANGDLAYPYGRKS